MSRTAPSPRPLRVSFPAEAVERMATQLKLERLPDNTPFSTATWEYGVDLQWLKAGAQ